MSLTFNDTSTLKGIVQVAERRLGLPSTYISGDTTRLKQFTADVNLALDTYTELAIRSSGKFQYDDSNHTTYPILTGDLVANQRDYSFTADSDGNLILEIYRVFVKNSATSPYLEIYPVDVQSDPEVNITKIADGLNTTGQPYRYDKTATGLFLDPIPSASVTAGLKVYVNREGSYLVYTDTTKKPGVPGTHHEYFVVKACYEYAKANILADISKWEAEVLKWEGDEERGIIGKIQRFFAHRNRDDRSIMSGKKILFI